MELIAPLMPFVLVVVILCKVEASAPPKYPDLIVELPIKRSVYRNNWRPNYANQPLSATSLQPRNLLYNNMGLVDGRETNTKALISSKPIAIDATKARTPRTRSPRSLSPMIQATSPPRDAVTRTTEFDELLAEQLARESSMPLGDRSTLSQSHSISILPNRNNNQHGRDDAKSDSKGTMRNSLDDGREPKDPEQLDEAKLRTRLSPQSAAELDHLLTQLEAMSQSPRREGGNQWDVLMESLLLHCSDLVQLISEGSDQAICGSAAATMQQQIQGYVQWLKQGQ
jgi:hypothetical protein